MTTRQALQVKLSESALGRCVLHLMCAVMFGQWARFRQGILREKDGERGEDEPFLKAFRRLDANEFSEQDVQDVVMLLNTLADRAETKYKDVTTDAAPWKDAVLQSAQNARDVAQQLREMFYAKAPNLKPIG